MESVPRITGYQTASSVDRFERTFVEKSRKDSSNEKLQDNFIIEGHESQSKAMATLLSDVNTTHHYFPFSSGTLIFIEENMLKPKQLGLNDQW